MTTLRNAVKRALPSFVIDRIDAEHRKETHMNRALGRFTGDTTYVEIGVRDGECIRQIEAARRIAIDPAPVHLDSPAWTGVEMNTVTSDEYFSKRRKETLHVALADGLHEFRQTLRDVLNLEKIMHPEGVIFIHDMNPLTRKNAEDTNGEWNGDVWKVAVYLNRYRTDLHYFTLDCDYGLGVVTGFSRNPAVPKAEHFESVASLDYDALARDRRNILNLRRPLRHYITGARYRA